MKEMSDFVTAQTFGDRTAYFRIADIIVVLPGMSSFGNECWSIYLRGAQAPIMVATNPFAGAAVKKEVQHEAD